MIWLSTVLLVLALACLAVGAVWKRFTLARTVQVMWWACCHPVRVFTSTYDRDVLK